MLVSPNTHLILIHSLLFFVLLHVPGGIPCRMLTHQLLGPLPSSWVWPMAVSEGQEECKVETGVLLLLLFPNHGNCSSYPRIPTSLHTSLGWLPHSFIYVLKARKIRASHSSKTLVASMSLLFPNLPVHAFKFPSFSSLHFTHIKLFSTEPWLSDPLEWG